MYYLKFSTLNVNQIIIFNIYHRGAQMSGKMSAGGSVRCWLRCRREHGYVIIIAISLGF